MLKKGLSTTLPYQAVSEFGGTLLLPCLEVPLLKIPGKIETRQFSLPNFPILTGLKRLFLTYVVIYQQYSKLNMSLSYCTVFALY